MFGNLPRSLIVPIVVLVLILVNLPGFQLDRIPGLWPSVFLGGLRPMNIRVVPTATRLDHWEPSLSYSS